MSESTATYQRANQNKPRTTRRTRREAAAERLVDAIAILLEEGVIESSDAVAFEDARAAVDKYRQA